MSVATAIAAPPVRLIDYAKAHLVVVLVREVAGVIARGAISIDGRVAAIADPVGPGAAISVDDEALVGCALRPQQVPLDVRYEDDDVLVCEKPAGMHARRSATGAR